MFATDPLGAEALMQQRVTLPWGAEVSIEEDASAG
jgi:hypothetical protein